MKAIAAASRMIFPNVGRYQRFCAASASRASVAALRASRAVRVRSVERLVRDVWEGWRSSEHVRCVCADEPPCVPVRLVCAPASCRCAGWRLCEPVRGEPSGSRNRVRSLCCCCCLRANRHLSNNRLRPLYETPATSTFTPNRKREHGTTSRGAIPLHFSSIATQTTMSISPMGARAFPVLIGLTAIRKRGHGTSDLGAATLHFSFIATQFTKPTKSRVRMCKCYTYVTERT